MSGRSGYVRVEQAARSQLNYQKVTQAQASKVKIDCANPESVQSELFCSPYIHQESSLFDTDDNSKIRPAQNMRHAILWSPTLSRCLTSQIERSSFRAKLDEKTIKCRNEIKRAFRMRRSRDTISNSTSPENARLDLTKLDGQLHEFSRIAEENDRSRSNIPNLPSESLATRFPPLPTQLRRWLGGARPMEPWAKLLKDPELFDQLGNTLVYLYDAEIYTLLPHPSFRINSHLIMATNSPILMRMLREGCTEDEISPEPSSYRQARTMHSPQKRQYHSQISYQLFFPVPYGLSKSDVQRHQVTTRNFFALLMKVSLVGQTMYQALYDLRNRVEEYMPIDTDPAGMIIDWIKSRGIDDPRWNLSTALSILAWAEGDCVHWVEGWKEAFCHAVGMLALDPHKKLELMPEFCYLSPVTKTLLARYSLNTKLLVRGCESRLDKFDFSDMWDVVDQKASTGRASFDRFRKFLIQHYQKLYGTWPPNMTDKKDRWLTRSLAKNLSRDFGALYDYLVNRTIIWDCEEERAGRKWNMKCTSNQSFDPDTTQIPMTDILISFDNRMEYPHIPHPYCLTPEPNKAQSKLKNIRKTGKKIKQQEDIMHERQATIAYQNSTNIYVLGAEFVSNNLVDAFTRFEQAECLIDADLYNCRRGRWVLIYGILQVLASISVDTPHLQFVENVQYHLQSSLRGTPPWVGADQNQPEAKHTSSHCWLAPARWRSLQPITLGSRSGFPESHAKSSIYKSHSNNSSACRSSKASYTSRDAKSSPQLSTFTSTSISSRISSSNQHSSCSPLTCYEIDECAKSEFVPASDDQISLSPSQSTEIGLFNFDIENLDLEALAMHINPKVGFDLENFPPTEVDQAPFHHK